MRMLFVIPLRAYVAGLLAVVSLAAMALTIAGR